MTAAPVTYHSGPQTYHDTSQRSNPLQDHAVMYVKVGASPTVRPVHLTETQLLDIIEQAATALRGLHKRNQNRTG